MVQVEIEYQNHIPSYLLLCSIYHVFNVPCVELGQAIWGLLVCTLPQEACPGEFKWSLYKFISHIRPQGLYYQTRTRNQL